MSGKAFETGKSLADLILAKLPESLRAEASKVFSASEAAEALTELGARGLAQSDYSRSMDQIRVQQADLETEQTRLNEIHEQQTGWWTTNKAALEDYKTLKATGGTPPAPLSPPASGISKEDLEKYLGERDRSYASVLGLATTLATRHYRDFNEVMDGNELIGFAEKNRLPLTEAYARMFAEKITAKQQAEEKVRIDKLVEERLVQERKSLSQQPFPLRNQEPSALDVIEQKDKPALPDPADFYQQLQASRG